MNRLWRIVLALLMALAASISSLGATSDFTLEIFGNANMDNTIDEKDVAYVEGVIKGTNAATNLSDANYDGEIDAKDIAQIERIIRGDDTEITIIDDSNEVVTIHKPVTRVVTSHFAIDDAMRLLGIADRIVAVAKNTKEQTVYFPELSQLPCIGDEFEEKDYELIMKTHPDLYIVRYAAQKTASIKEKLPGVTVISSTLSHPTAWDYVKDGGFEERMIKFGYIFNMVDEAKEFLAWQNKWLNELENRIEKIPEEDKPRVFCGGYENGVFGVHVTTGVAQLLDIISAKNIGKEVAAGTSQFAIETEWLVEQNPDIIIVNSVGQDDFGYETDDISGMEAMRREIVDLPALANVNAVKNNRVYVLRGMDYIPGYCVGAAYLAKWIYPDQFIDFDPRDVHQEYLDLIGLDFNVFEHGTFIYPPLNGS